MTGTAPLHEANLVPEGEFAFTASDFRQITALVHAEAGIVLADGKANLVYSRLAKRLRAIGLRNFRDYCNLIASKEGVDERQALIAALTTNTTRFFREPYHFAHLAHEVLPGLLKTARQGGRVRIWSAGCSSGEEPYTIAMTLLESMPNAPEYDILILATDIDPDMLNIAKTGVYPGRLLEQIPGNGRKRWLKTERSVEDGFSISEPARNLIRFRELNLLGEWPMKSRFDVIFCRNVTIYFDEATQDKLWRRFSQHLEPGGHLYIGHSERIAAGEHSFELVAQTTYKKVRT